MTTKDNGGPAFPVNELHQETGTVCAQHFGCTMRDYFAAKALQGICASGPSSRLTNQNLATEAYDLADAMLEARNK